jgi:hypothetical protein
VLLAAEGRTTRSTRAVQLARSPPGPYPGALACGSSQHIPSLTPLLKAADVVGLYIDPPKKAIVLCVDEKPSIQALERAQGYLKLPNGRALTGQSHDYKRHGTTTLFAALEVASGKVLGEHSKGNRCDAGPPCVPRTRRQEARVSHRGTPGALGRQLEETLAGQME